MQYRAKRRELVQGQTINEHGPMEINESLVQPRHCRLVEGSFDPGGERVGSAMISTNVAQLIVAWRYSADKPGHIERDARPRRPTA